MKLRALQQPHKSKRYENPRNGRFSNTRDCNSVHYGASTAACSCRSPPSLRSGFAAVEDATTHFLKESALRRFRDKPRLPIVDLSLFELGDPWRDHLAAQLDWAASEFGCFYVVGHG